MFKKLLTVAALISGITFAAQAQDFSVFANPVDSTTSGTPVKTSEMEGYPYIELANHLTNVSSDSILVSWSVVSVAIPTDWLLVGICDNINCFGDAATLGGAVHQTKKFGAGKQCLFDARVYAPITGANGTGTVKVAVNTLGQTDTLVFIVNKTPTSVHTILLDDKRVSLYPNPATSQLQVYADKVLNPAQITVYGINGAQSSLNIPVIKGTEVTNIDINNFAAGIYMVRVTDATGKVITTRKFTKK